MNYNLQEESDEVLMLSLQEGNDSAFEELVRRYKVKLFNYIYRYIRHRERSEEIAQEVFIRVYRSRFRYKIKAKFSTFIYRIALNLSFNEVRNVNRRKTDLQNNFEEGIFKYRMEESNTPDKIYERQELERVINNEIANLSDRYRDVILLCDMEGLSYKEAADVLGISIGTVQSRLSRGRIRLKRRLSSFLRV